MEALPPPPPSAVPLADMCYVIRGQGQQYAICAFAYFMDATAMMKILKATITDLVPHAIYEMVDNITGDVLYTTSEPTPQV